MGDPFKDEFARFDGKGLAKDEAVLSKVWIPLRKLPAKADAETRCAALQKAIPAADLEKLAGAADKRAGVAKDIAGIDDPVMPDMITWSLSVMLGTVKKEVKAVGKGGPFPQTQKAIAAAVAAYRKETADQDAKKEEARKVWSALKNELRNDATFIESQAEQLQKFCEALVKDAARIPKGPKAEKHRAAAARLKTSVSALITAMDDAAKHADKVFETYNDMQRFQLEAADNMEKPGYLKELVDAQ